VRSDNRARLVNDFTLATRRATVAQQAAVIAIGHKTDLLALRLLRGHKATRTCDFADFWLRHAAQRKSRSCDCGAVETVQEIGLVFLAVDGGAQSPRAPVIRDSATCVVPSGNGIAAEEGTPLTNECAELDRRVAANAWARRFTALIGRNKWLQDGIGELLFKVLNVERDAKMIGNATRIIGGIKGAAALAMSVALIGGAMQSHPYADNLMASFNQECGSDRRVNAT
jgi:hypothetical protein